MPWDNAMEPLLNLQEFMKTDPSAGPTHKPVTIQELGLRQTVLEDLALKHLYLSGPFSVLDMAKHMRISFEVASELLKRLRTEQLCQVTGLSGQIQIFAITSQGRTRAQELLAQSQYTGAAPVPLTSYVNQVKLQSVSHVEVHPTDVQRVFSTMVLDDRILWQLGTALNSGAAIFLYGPSGVGKTTIAELMSKALSDDAVWVPYAIEIDGQIITVYDPTLHQRMAHMEPPNHDERWVLCQRPSVMVGGELTSGMLDLSVQSGIEVLHRSGADEGQQRRAHHRRLRAPESASRRASESLGGAVGPQDRLPDARRRSQHRNALRNAGGLRLEPGPGATTRRSIPAQNSDQDLHWGSQRRGVLRDLPVATERKIECDDTVAHTLIDFVHGTLKQELARATRATSSIRFAGPRSM